MKKTILVALSIVLMLFAFASCSNDSSKPGFTGDASEVAEALDPAKLVGDVLKSDAENVDVEYKLIQGGASSAAAKAVTGSATLQATVTFDGYKVPNTSYVITDGTLVYAFEGTVSAEGKFTASSAATVKTGSKLIVDTDKGNAEVAISEVKASVNAFTADVSKAGSDGVLPADTSISVNVTVDEDIKVSVGDDDVTVEPEEPSTDPDPAPTMVRVTFSYSEEIDETVESIVKGSEYTFKAPTTEQTPAGKVFISWIAGDSEYFVGDKLIINENTAFTAYFVDTDVFVRIGNQEFETLSAALDSIQAPENAVTIEILRSIENGEGISFKGIYENLPVIRAAKFEKAVPMTAQEARKVLGVCSLAKVALCQNDDSMLEKDGEVATEVVWLSFSGTYWARVGGYVDKNIGIIL